MVEVVVAAFVDIVVDTENYDFQYLDIPLLAVVVEVVVAVANKVVESGIAPFVHLPKGLLQLHIVVVVVVVAVAVVVACRYGSI